MKARIIAPPVEEDIITMFQSMPVMLVHPALTPIAAPLAHLVLPAPTNRTMAIGIASGATVALIRISEPLHVWHAQSDLIPTLALRNASDAITISLAFARLHHIATVGAAITTVQPQSLLRRELYMLVIMDAHRSTVCWPLLVFESTAI